MCDRALVRPPTPNAVTTAVQIEDEALRLRQSYRVDEATAAIAEDCGVELGLLPGWYDVDDQAALGRLARDLETAWGAERAPLTARCLLDLHRAGVV